MNIFSDNTILVNHLGAKFDMYRVFLAEKIIMQYIGKKPKNWDETLAIATAEIYKKLERNNGIKSESVEWHSIHFSEAKSVADFIGVALAMVLDGYKNNSTNKNISRSFSLM